MNRFYEELVIGNLNQENIMTVLENLPTPVLAGVGISLMNIITMVIPITGLLFVDISFVIGQLLLNSLGINGYLQFNVKTLEKPFHNAVLYLTELTPVSLKSSSAVINFIFSLILDTDTHIPVNLYLSLF